jgi:hypothetical protein
MPETCRFLIATINLYMWHQVGHVYVLKHDARNREPKMFYVFNLFRFISSSSSYYYYYTLFIYLYISILLPTVVI